MENFQVGTIVQVREGAGISSGLRGVILSKETAKVKHGIEYNSFNPNYNLPIKWYEKHYMSGEIVEQDKVEYFNPHFLYKPLEEAESEVFDYVKYDETIYGEFSDYKFSIIDGEHFEFYNKEIDEQFIFELSSFYVDLNDGKIFDVKFYETDNFINEKSNLYKKMYNTCVDNLHILDNEVLSRCNRN